MKVLDRLKNRATAPRPDQINPEITAQALFAPGNDLHRWSSADGATITIYVRAVKVGGIETCNCGARQARWRDTHIEGVLEADSPSQPIIVEVTPRWRAAMKAMGIDWSTTALRRALVGHYVQVTGWLLYDAEHANAAINTAPRNPKDWRVTVWEIHPVTALKVLRDATRR